MYFRMAFLMLIALYTSRVILEKLGVTDFGIYNLVGSLVAIFGSLRSLFSTSTQRFLSTDLGKRDEENLNKTFNHGLYINTFFAIVVIIVAEIAGFCFFTWYINVDDTRLLAAEYVFHFSVISSAVVVFTSSFDALCIAHEKMSFYAYVSIIEGLLQLGIVYLLSVSPIDRLVFYGFLKLVVSLLILFANIVYCRYMFRECYLKNCFDKAYLKKMIAFSGWSFLGSTSFTLTQQGLNMVLNIFGGPIVNAARGIAYQVNGAINQFMNNIIVAIRPFCIKSYAEGRKDKTYNLLFLYTKLSFCIQLSLITPIIFFTKQIFNFWLGQVPEYSVLFTQLVLCNTLIRTFHPAVDLIFMANGNLKHYQLAEGVILLLPLIVSYFMLQQGFPFHIAFLSIIVFEIVNLVTIMMIAYKIADFPVRDYCIDVLLHCMICTIVGIIIFRLTNLYTNFWHKLLGALIIVLFGWIYIYKFCLKSDEIKQLKSLRT